MKLVTLATIIFCCCAFSVSAQNPYSIKGTTVDTALKTRLSTTIIIMNAKDSILRRSALSASDGTFTITGLPAGRFLVLITYPDYADFVARITLGPTNKENDFGNIKMSPTARLLQEVIIKSEVTPIKIKGDTTEFNPRAYVIQPNDKVEDLLRQLPGIEIDKDGKITAQGLPVPKVLLDGEEFFRDDPTLITRNIRADMVDKVQLYDKKSDQATFTGIDDGIRTKTINIKLKEDSKVGYFGKEDAGIGNGGYYEGQGLFNQFKDKYKFSVYGTASNDGKLGLGLQDNSSLGMGNAQISDDGGAITIYGSNDPLDAESYSGVGLPESKTGGVHYDNKWNSDKESINTNYKIGSLAINTDQTSFSQANYDAYITKTDGKSHQYSNLFRQKADAIYSKALSPTANIKIDVSAAEKNTENDRTSQSSVSNGDDVLRTTDNTVSNSTGHIKTLTADIFYTKKLKKMSRTFSWDVNGNYNHEISTLYYLSDLYTASTKVDSVTDQYKPTVNTTLVLNSNMTYTEPITPQLALTFNYGFGLNNSESDKLSYNKSASGAYDILDNVYSNDYKFNVLTNQLAAVFNYRGGANTILTFGTRANAVNFKQVDEFTGIPYKRSFINWKPQVTFLYRPGVSRSLRLEYNGTSQQPTIDQIQPLRNNTSSLNTIIGNPDLQPSFVHLFNLFYSSYKRLTSQSFSINGHLSLTTNYILGNTITDTVTFRSTTRYVNLSNKVKDSYGINGNFSQKITTLDVQAGISFGINGNTSYSYNNNVLYANYTYTYGSSVILSKYKVKKYSFNLSGGPNWVLSNTLPISKNFSDNNSLGYHISARALVFLPLKFQISSDILDNYKPKTNELPALTTTMWNAALSKTFLKDDKLKISLSADNLLNQVQNFTNQNGIYINQSTSNSIKRYFMFTVTWDFKQFGTVKN